MDLSSSGPACLVWVAADGRRSVWWRKTEEALGQELSLPDLLPWLLFPDTGVDVGACGPCGGGDAPEAIEVGSRKRWASIAEGDEECEEDIAGLRQLWQGADAAASAAAAAASEDGPPEEEEPEESATATDLSVGADAARISALLDVRQSFGHDRSSHDILSGILMDHDLLRRQDEDVMVPAIDSPLWERLADLPRQSALQRLRNFKAIDPGFVPEAAPDLTEMRCGRHRIPCEPTDVQALLRRWTGPNDPAKRTAAMAHVFALYRVFENPLTPYWERSPMQLGWIPAERKRAGVQFELFASPFNAQVGMGRYASRWPHVEASFGSLGSYPDVLSKIPANATVGINPPFTEAYLDHVVGQSLEGLVTRFKKVCLTVPVREAPWRRQLRRLKGAHFVPQFWDSTAQAEKNLGHPVLFWEGSELDPP